MAIPTLSTIPERIAWARTCAGLTPNRLSVLAGLDRSHIRLIEDGGGRTAAETVGKIANVLKITTDWLISGVGAEPDPDTLRALGDSLGARREADSAHDARDSHPAGG